MLLVVPFACLALPQGFTPIDPHAEPGSAEIVRYAELRAALPATGGGLVALGDVDGDLDLDLLSFDLRGGELLRNRGDGVFDRGPRPGLPGPGLPGVRPLGLALGDLDGDGDLDLVGSKPLFGFHLAANDGSGSFATVASPALGGHGATPFELGDVDGDGFLDLFLADALYAGLGAMDFAELPNAVPATPAEVSDVELGDLDGDGDVDAFLAVASGSTGDVLLLREAGGLYADASGQLGGPARTTRDAVLVDVDGDGDLDVVLANDDGQQNGLLRNDGTGAFADATADLPDVDDSSAAVAAVDAEGDGAPDLLFGNWRHEEFGDFGSFFVPGAENRLLTNGGSGVFVDAPGALDLVRDSTVSLAVGDVDGDGDPDVLSGEDPATRRLRAHGLLLGDAAGAFRLARPGLPVSLLGSSAVLAADLDGDGYQDLAVAPDRLLLGDGSGSFDEAPFPVTGAVVFGVGDVDGDGDLDLLGVTPYDGEFFPEAQDNHLWINDGSAGFTDEAATRLPTHPPDDRGVAQDGLLVDVDVDGDLDAATANRDDFDGQGGGVALYLNDGAGFFGDASSQVSVSSPAGGLSRLRAPDLDGDGAPELVVLGSLFETGPGLQVGVHLLANDGTGVFAWQLGGLPALDGSLFPTARWVEVGDLDADGDVDVAGASSSSSTGIQSFVARNDGSGGFTDVRELPARLPLAFHFADVDEDGDLDLASPRELIELLDGIYRRRGDWHPPVASGTDRLAFLDLDLDGDVDAYLARSGQDTTWSNLARQVARLGMPRVGQPLRLEVWGPPGEPWVLWRSLGRGSTVTPEGLFQLADPGLTSVATGVADDEGGSEVAFPIPSTPALVGVTFYWQALVGGGAPRWTNLERTTLTNL